MSGPSRREEQDRRSRQPVTRFSLKRLFNKLTGLLGIRALFNFFARPRGPRPVPIKIDPAWFPVPQPAVPTDEADWTPPRPDTPNVLPPWEPPWVQTSAYDAEPAYEAPLETEHPDDFDPVAFAEEYPDWDEEPPDPEPSDIHVRPGERVPDDAGALLRTFYLPGVGDVRIYARLHPDEMDIQPDQIIEPGGLTRDFNTHFRPKGPKRTK
ncbi:hypothetical protein GCM10007972_12990 [Iodidimonas muriae]|uniref:Uncharacterized protein n=1 Tax=Iodidimonas muriae TaxID=261467 RepID=A0ABQ2LCY8_9PROT|nr:hypothetical protein [Iodidimonas muriae]GER06696.1 hypothetical protein JCM17843_10060 [Kordiimonadales bacterium JCM 17843]GGO10343.1 hypothetical protein GCM10007972_12990 [Iodidimonas muriae]